MGGDYTRFTFDPVKGFSGALKQQGRVSLDSNANEFEEILDRRDRAETYDTFGQAVYPLTTPDAFKIAVGAGGELTIGQGRMYVDGILSECFGDMIDPANTNFDEHMNDLVGKDPLFYTKQPFFYTKPPFPDLSATPGVINLVYLDVWQREVTVFEDYALREIALNGPDTDTRVQTAWQVKVMGDPVDDNCAAPSAAWTALIAPSTGRLTATATPAPPAPGPCVISPAGGYTGLENRLYRVEVHTAGTVDGATKATFKWSRDNASLAARVLSTTQITPTDAVITVGSTGRDSWMRFEFGDHIELLDDNVEFSMRETGTGGIMAKVTSVNHATGEIHVDQDLTALPIVAGRHPRIRRWDIASAIEPFVRDTSNGVAIPLENGITVTFGPSAADTLHAGDYWVFAARTADGSIDELMKQPPRNILHHFAKLALVASGNPPVVLSDCRTPWPPAMGTHEGCCSQVVEVGDDIQKAIDKLDGIGGCVCLKMGVHHIREPLRITQENVTMHGEVPWVTIRLDADGVTMLVIGARAHINVDGILFEARDGMNPDPMIRVEGATNGRISRCGLRLIGETPNPAFAAIGIQLTRCREYAIDSVEMRNLPNGVRGLECSGISVLDSQLEGPQRKTHAGDAVSLGVMGIQFEGELLAGIYIERNILTDYQRGIQLGDIGSAIMPGGGGNVNVTRTVDGCRIVANVILRKAGVTGGHQPVPAIAFAIAAHVARCEIVENSMNIETLQQYGILVAGGNTLVHRNEVRSHATFDPNKPLNLIPIGVAAIETQTDALLCSIRGNLFTGLQQAVRAAAVQAGRPRVDILDNRVEGMQALVDAISTKVTTGGGSSILNLLGLLENFSSIVISQLDHCRIADNEVATAVCGVAGFTTVGTSVVSNRVSASLAGVILLRAGECEVGDNIIDAPLRSKSILGVGLFKVDRSVAARNAVTLCEEGVLSTFCTSVRVQDNDIYRTRNGIVSLIDVDLELRGNNIEDAAETGIRVVFSLHELTLAHDRVVRSGYRQGAFSPSPAIGIEIKLSISLVTIEGCHVIDTGESADPGAPVFTGARHGIRVLWAIGARVRGSEVASKPLIDAAGGSGINSVSRALTMLTLTPALVVQFLPIVGRLMIPFADATDNVIEQSVVALVQMLAFGEIMFATNRCTNFASRNVPSVFLLAEDVTVTGNRVRSPNDVRSLLVAYNKSLSAVGNITTQGAQIIPTGLGPHTEAPTPYTTFNVATFP
jgi:hypothetical protein